MKSKLTQILAIILVSAFTASMANAHCVCVVKNAKGQTWLGSAQTKSQAAANAQKFCVNNSKAQVNCVNTGCSCG